METHTKIQNNMDFIWNTEISRFSIPQIGKLVKQYVKFLNNVHKIAKKSFHLTKTSKNIKENKK